MSDDYFYEKDEDGSPYYDTDKSEPLLLEENGLMSARAQDELIETLKRDNFEMKLRLYDEQKANAGLKDLVRSYEMQLRELQLENERLQKDNGQLKRTVSKLRSQSEAMYHSPPSRPHIGVLEDDDLEKATPNSDTDMDRYFAKSAVFDEAHLANSSNNHERKKASKHADFINEYDVPRGALNKKTSKTNPNPNPEPVEEPKNQSGVFKNLISKIKHKK